VSLSGRLEELRTSRAVISKQRLPAVSKIEQSLQRLTEKYDRVGVTSEIDYAALIVTLRSLFQSGRLTDLSPREVRLTASCLFEGHPQLANDAAFLDQYLNVASLMNSRITVKRLIHTYCLHFDQDHRGIRQIGEFLQRAISANACQSGWDWQSRHAQYKIFEPNLVSDRIARSIANSPSPRAELENLGLKGQLLVSGLSAAVFLQALHTLRQKLESDPRIDDVDRIISWARADNGELYYFAHRGALANALLHPWSGGIPNEPIRQKIQSFLLDNLSDPRIDGGAWVGVDPVARDIMIRWLAQATLTQFLEVVDRVAEKQQWHYRRAFWTAYIERRVVSNAWVAFGNTGAQVARRLADDSADSLMRRFGILSGASADQAVLLLHIGDLIIADWSHNGRLRIWRQQNRSAPEFNLSSYTAPELRAGSDFDTVHLPPEGWQSTAEAYIRRHTGIRLDRADYMPARSRRR
jgi:EH_Signature domain